MIETISLSFSLSVLLNTLKIWVCQMKGIEKITISNNPLARFKNNNLRKQKGIYSHCGLKISLNKNTYFIE